MLTVRCAWLREQFRSGPGTKTSVSAAAKRCFALLVLYATLASSRCGLDPDVGRQREIRRLVRMIAFSEQSQPKREVGVAVRRSGDPPHDRH